MTENLSFRDRALSDVVQKSAFKLANFQKHADEATEDIKNLEKWLADCGISMYFSVKTAEERTCIAWSKVSDRWRLVCEQEKDVLKIPGMFENPLGPKTEIHTKPLVDMPLRIRLLCRPFLPEMVRGIADLLPEPPAGEPAIEPEDPPTEKVEEKKPKKASRSLFKDVGKKEQSSASKTEEVTDIFSAYGV